MKRSPLAGVRILDFSTLLPGPMCTLLCAEAGADVLKIERPDQGDEMRSYTPRFGDTSVNFALLNRGKRSEAIDLKSAAGHERVIELVRSADVLVEQFRPGVMARLGLGYEALSVANPRLVYCSITGYGQTGPLAQTAAHDLNFVAQSGMLSLSATPDGQYCLPHALLGDLGGGAYPAMMNILLALRQRDIDGGGCHLDISMADNLFTFMYWALGEGWSEGQWPASGKSLVTGGSPRYNLYTTADGACLAAAPLEEKFWGNFLLVLDAAHLVDDSADPLGTCAEVAKIIGSRSASEWLRRFDGIDACVSIAASLAEAVSHPHFVARGLFCNGLADGSGRRIPALPVPIAHCFRQAGDAASPRLGSASAADDRGDSTDPGRQDLPSG